MSAHKYEIRWTGAAKKMLAGVQDRRIMRKIFERANELSEEPELQGKPLLNELAGYRSVRAVGQRYRIIYKIENKKIIVYVVALGIRKEESKKDIYELAKKLIRAGLLESPE
ncbi:MAG: type II toxin-antitoxin system RelE/ParE family toxin [bacterium]